MFIVSCSVALCLKQPNTGAAIFDDVASLVYNLADAKRHWKTYISNVKLIPVPSVPYSASTQPTEGAVALY